MAYINASTEAKRVKLLVIRAEDLTTAGTPVYADFVSSVAGDGAVTEQADVLQLPGLQDVTINNSNGSFRWKQMDLGGESVITTNATNSLSGNFVLDPDTFWGTGSAGDATSDGVFGLSNDRIEIAFLIAPSGLVAGETYLLGTGFISALAPTASADSPVWVSPITVEVNGDYTKAVAA